MSNVKKVLGKGRPGAVVDLSDPDFANWPPSFEGDTYISGSAKDGWTFKPNNAGPKPAKSRLGLLEERIEALEALIVS